MYSSASTYCKQGVSKPDAQGCWNCHARIREAVLFNMQIIALKLYASPRTCLMQNVAVPTKFGTVIVLHSQSVGRLFACYEHAESFNYFLFKVSCDGHT